MIHDIDTIIPYLYSRPIEFSSLDNLRREDKQRSTTRRTNTCLFELCLFVVESLFFYVVCRVLHAVCGMCVAWLACAGWVFLEVMGVEDERTNEENVVVSYLKEREKNKSVLGLPLRSVGQSWRSFSQTRPMPTCS